MDLTIWTPVFTIIGANIALMMTSIGIAIALYLHSDKKMSDAIKEMRDEMKDFHGRLCAIESRKIGGGNHDHCNRE